MPIAMERFSSHGQLPRYDQFHGEPSQRSAKLQIQCCVCNFEPDMDEPLMHVCPKCHASVWEWIVRRENLQPSERAGHRIKFKPARRFATHN